MEIGETFNLVCPTVVCEKLQEFMEQEKTGSITLHFKEGRILAWAFTENGRAEKPIGIPQPPYLEG